MSLNRHKFHWSLSYTCFVETFYREEFLKMMFQCQHHERRKMGDRTFSSIDRAFKASAIRVKIIRNSHIFRRQLPTCSQRYQDPRWYRYRKGAKKGGIHLGEAVGEKKKKKFYSLKTTFSWSNIWNPWKKET